MLPRHAHHHLRAGDPFWELKAYPGALALESGYMAAILLAMVPPVWTRMMARALRYWDEKLATREERALIRAAGTARCNAYFSLVQAHTLTAQSPPPHFLSAFISA